ncbi:MAG TPA: nitrogen fixation protein NifX [Kineosporiaceae bacterium]|nr:nitrogen fixation protein NifX [Kineosporiaceae bacterium]
MLRIAFATADGTAVDQHFGWCRRFDVYEFDAGHARLAAIRELPAVPGEEDGKIEARLDAVRDCAIVHIAAIGGTAAARVVNAGLMPVKVPEGTAVADLVLRLQDVLQGSPPPWLRKVLRRHDPATPVWSPA